VPIREASHETYEFYRYRADITKRLIAEKAFHVVAARSRQRGEASSGMETWLDRVMVERTCPDCKGARLRATRLLFNIAGKTARFTSDCLLKGFHRLFPSERFCFYRLQVVKKVLF
jgi:excinuclease UvrABC ATPase subunit